MFNFHDRTRILPESPRTREQTSSKSISDQIHAFWNRHRSGRTVVPTTLPAVPEDRTFGSFFLHPNNCIQPTITETAKPESERIRSDIGALYKSLGPTNR